MTVLERRREIANRSYHKNKECNREARRLRSERYRLENPERWKETYTRSRKKNIEKARAAARKWQIENPEKVRELAARYYARKLAATIGVVDYEAILERDGLWCYLCETDVLPDEVHFDHVVPLSKGGEHSMRNIRITHDLCNLRKGDRLLEQAGLYSQIADATGEHIA